MSIELRMPNINGNEREQLVQIRSYLYQLIPQLQWALNNTSTSPTNYVVQQARNGGSANMQVATMSLDSGGDFDAEVAFDALKPLIIKSADIVQAYYEEINAMLKGEYVAESDFGTFMEQTEANFTKTSTYVDQQYNDVQVIISDEVEGIKVTFNSALEDTKAKTAEDIANLATTTDAKIDEVNASIGELNADIADTNSRIDTTNDRIDETNTAIGELRTTIGVASGGIDLLNTSIADANERMDGISASIESTNGKIDELNDSIDGVNANIESLTSTIEEANANIDELIEAKELSEGDIEKINSDIASINGKVSEIDTTVQVIDGEVKTLDSTVQTIDGNISALDSNVGTINSRVGDLDAQVGTANEQIGDLNSTVTEVNGEIKNLKTKNEETVGKLGELNSAIDGANKSVENLRAAIIEANAYIRSGLLYYADNGIPVYGLEIGQENTVNGAEVFNKYARFTSEKLSFYDKNDTEVGYISDYKLYITNVLIKGSFQEGGYKDFVDSYGGIVTKWIGGA